MVLAVLTCGKKLAKTNTMDEYVDKKTYQTLFKPKLGFNKKYPLILCTGRWDGEIHWSFKSIH